MKKLSVIVLAIFVLTVTQKSFASDWNQVYSSQSMTGIGVDNSGNLYAGGRFLLSFCRIVKSTDEGNTWNSVYTGAAEPISDFGFDNIGTVYAANFSTGLLKSVDQGNTFTVLWKQTHFNNKNVQTVECGSNGYVFVGTTRGFFRSTNYGVSFTETGLQELNCRDILVDKDDPNIIYVAINNTPSDTGGVYISTDTGLTFTTHRLREENVFKLLQTENGDIYRLSTNTPYNLKKSTDKGLTWITLGDLPELFLGMTEYFSFSTSKLYFSGTGGVFSSTDGGMTFQTESTIPFCANIMNVKHCCPKRFGIAKKDLNLICFGRISSNFLMYPYCYFQPSNNKNCFPSVIISPGGLKGSSKNLLKSIFKNKHPLIAAIRFDKLHPNFAILFK